MSIEITVGFFKKHVEKPKEKFEFAFLTLLKKDTSKTKTYSKFKISNKGMEILGLTLGTKDQTVAMSFTEDKTFVLLNMTGYADSKAKGVFLLSKSGTFNNNQMFDAISKQFEFKDDVDNHVKLTTPEEDYTVNKRVLKAADIKVIDATIDNSLEITGDLGKKDESNEDLEKNFEKSVDEEVSKVEKIIEDNFDDIEDLKEDDNGL